MSLLYFDAYTQFGPRQRRHGAYPWSLQQLIDELDHCSISAALVSSTAQMQYDSWLENQRLVQTLAPYPHLHPIWNVWPHWTGEMPAPEDLLSQMEAAGVRAVTLRPQGNGWDLRASSSRPLLEALAAARRLVIYDYRADGGGREIEFLAETYPELPILLRGMWWSQSREVLPLILNHRSLHLGFDTFQVNYCIEFLAERGCEDQMVFCSNATDMSIGAHRFYVDYADISAAARAKVAGGNLLRLLDLPAPALRENRDEDEIMAQARRGEPLSTLVLDMHAHMLDEGVDGAGAAYTMLDGGPSGTYKLAQRMGVDGIGIMSWDGTVGVHADQGNACVTRALDAYPDFYWGLGTFDVRHDTREQMLAKMKALYADKRFLGLKPYPAYGVPYNEPVFDVWWEFGNERGLYAGFHPHNWYQAAEFESVCSRFPNLTVVAFHCGGSYEIADTVIDLAKRFENFMIEITLTPSCLGVVDYLVAGAGVDRVMYGSDLPMRDPRQQLGWVVYSRLPLADKRLVLGGNAKRLLDDVRSRQGKFA